MHALFWLTALVVSKFCSIEFDHLSCILKKFYGTSDGFVRFLQTSVSLLKRDRTRCALTVQWIQTQILSKTAQR